MILYLREIDEIFEGKKLTMLARLLSPFHIYYGRYLNEMSGKTQRDTRPEFDENPSRGTSHVPLPVPTH